jgi:hypothetical protein
MLADGRGSLSCSAVDGIGILQSLTQGVDPHIQMAPVVSKMVACIDEIGSTAADHDIRLLKAAVGVCGDLVQVLGEHVRDTYVHPSVPSNRTHLPLD